MLGLQTSIWGLSKQGKTCKLCGISVHAKCELKVSVPIGQLVGDDIAHEATKVAADCARAKGSKSNLSQNDLSRTASTVSTNSSAVSARSSMCTLAILVRLSFSLGTLTRA
jgi:hypothetical protein